MLLGETGPLVLPKQQESKYTWLLDLMGRKSFVQLVSAPPGSGSKTLVRSAARTRGLVPQDFDIEWRHEAQELRRRLSRLCTHLLGIRQDVVWVVHNAELVDAQSSVWKSPSLKEQRIVLLVHDVPPGLRARFAPLYVNRLTDYAIQQILHHAIERGELPLEHAAVYRVARRAAGDLHQAFILARFTTGQKDLMPHRWFDTKALLNGQRVESSKVDAPWLFENMMDRCVALERAARMADAFAFTNALEGHGGYDAEPELAQTCNQIVHDSVWWERETLRKSADVRPRAPHRLLPGTPLHRRVWNSYGPSLLSNPETNSVNGPDFFVNPVLHSPVNIDDIMHARLWPAAHRKRPAVEATPLVPGTLDATLLAAPRSPKRPCVDSVLPDPVQEAPRVASHAPDACAPPPPKRAREDVDSNPPSPRRVARRVDVGPLATASFDMPFNPDRFEEGNFKSNLHLARLENDDLLQESLKKYTSWLRRFFVCIVEQSTEVVAQIIYYEGSDRIQEVICRSTKGLIRTFPTLKIALKLQPSRKKDPVMMPLLEWYINGTHRLTKRHVNMWTTEEDIKKNCHDLNLFGGLRFDGRLATESLVKERFSDPFPEAVVHRSARGLAPVPPDVSSAAAFTAPDAEWRRLEGKDFIIWHIKYVLINNNAEAFAYFMQWCAFIFQLRRKPGVMPQLLGEEGIGKSAILGSNQSGPGIFKRIYEQYYQWSNDIDSLLGNFNADSMNKLFCLMEEGGTYRKGFRNNDKLKSLLSEGTQRVEMKHVNAFQMNDNRAFAMCTNNRDSLKIMPGSRRFLCLEGNDLMSQRAVDEGRMNRATRQEYMKKLDHAKNSDEVAYQFFKYCMSLDITHFNVDDPVRTSLFEEQRSHNECVVKQFLEQVRSGEYRLRQCDGEDPFASRLQGEHTFTATQLFGRLKTFAADTGAYLNVDSAKSLGHALSKQYAAMAPKVPGRIAKYRVQVAVGV